MTHPSASALRRIAEMSVTEHYSPSPARSPEQQKLLNERYGTSGNTNILRNRKLWWIAGGIIAAIVFAIMIMIAFEPKVESKMLGYEVKDSTVTTASFEVIAPQGASVRCFVQALSSSYAAVGAETVDIDNATGEPQIVEEDLRTEATAVSVDIEKCWIS